MSRPRLMVLLLALVTLVVYLPVTRFAFTNFDDDVYVTANPEVQNGLTLAGVKWAFTTFHGSNWHPVTWLSHMADCQLFGLNAGAQHAVNVLFHAANTVLLFLLLLRLTSLRVEAPARQAEKLWPCAFVAALFAWHPLHVESVAWIAERKDVLSAFFALLSLLGYAQYVKLSEIQSPRSKVFYAASLGCFALGLMSKPMVVTLPFVLLLLDFWPLQRLDASTWPRQLAEKIPFFLLSAGSCVVTYLAQSQHNANAVVSMEQVPFRYRLENVALAYVEYLQKLVWPTKLAVFYPLAKQLSLAAAVAAAVGLIVLLLAAWQTRKTRPCLLVGLLWFLGMLVPVIGLVQVGGAALADRYTYLPSVGFFLAIVFSAADFAARRHIPKTLVAGVSGLLLAGCLFATEHQLQFWRNSETLFRHALAVTPDNDVARIDLGLALDEQGQSEAAADQYRAAEKLNPSRFQSFANLGRLLDQLGRPAEALAQYRQAVRLQPDDPALHCALGGELAALGQFAAALKEFAEAERLAPHYAWAHVETAKVLFKQGRDADATAELRAALRLAPDDFRVLATTAHYLAANENTAARDSQAALALALKASILSGRNQPLVFDVLGMAFAATGDFSNAQTCAENAVELGAAAHIENLEAIRHRLELYQAHRPWRESFLATNAPVKN